MGKFNLSKKGFDVFSEKFGVQCDRGYASVNDKYYQERDVKEFIKRLKEEIVIFGGIEKRRELAFINGIIDKLAGDKLKWKPVTNVKVKLVILELKQERGFAVAVGIYKS